jgi:hypothetical protein
MADAWVSRRETAAYHQVKIYCSICGVLIEPDMVDAIFTELSKECQHSKNALYCTTANLETRYFEGINGCAWTSLFRLSKLFFKFCFLYIILLTWLNG